MTSLLWKNRSNTLSPASLCRKREPDFTRPAHASGIIQRMAAVRSDGRIKPCTASSVCLAWPCNSAFQRKERVRLFHIKSNCRMLIFFLKFPRVPLGTHKRVAENFCCSLYFWWYSDKDINVQLVIVNKTWTCEKTLCMLVTGLYVKQFAFVVNVFCRWYVLLCFKSVVVFATELSYFAGFYIIIISIVCY